MEKSIRSEKSMSSGFLTRLLYKNYCNVTVVGFFFTRRITPTAWFLIGLAGISLLMGVNVGESVVIILTALLSGMLFVGLLWAFLRRAKVSIMRDLPTVGAVGEEISYLVKVTNNGRSTLRDIRLNEASDDPRPTEWEFLNLIEPGEEKRNIFDRTFLFYRWKWLVARGGKWTSLGASKSLEVEPGETIQNRLAVIPNRRGVFSLTDLRVELPDPFGLFQRCRYVGQKSDEVLVIPKRYRLPELQILGKSELKVGGETASTVRGDGGEFLGLREYHQGDSLRRIDWKAWARTGEPIVRQYEEARFPRYGLILDTNMRESGPELFEEAVSVVASFVSTMDQNRCLLDFMFVRDAPEVFKAGRGVARASRLLEVLARVEGNNQGGYDLLQKLVLHHAAEMTACVVVLSGWNQERRDFVALLRQSGLEVTLYVIGAGKQPADATGVHWLRWDAVQEDLLTNS
ncbi:DUF58 domain-containing protein [Akkermansiaceae bacterium]|nr:DUF58 domain-containing protein [Akkermansiaceae bacterium]